MGSFLYSVIFDGDFDKYWADFLPYFQKYRVPPVITLAKDFPADGFTNIESFLKFFRDHQVNSLAEYGALWMLLQSRRNGLQERGL